MEYRGKYNPKIVFPSFTLVLTQYILKRTVRGPSARLKWTNVPGYNTKRVPVRTQPAVEVDWAMTTIDRRYEPEETYSHASGLALIPTVPLNCRQPPSSSSEQPEGPSLSSVDDETMSIVSTLDLNSSESRSPRRGVAQ